jgi:predicted O-methyltransferase YrrM
VRTCLTPDRAAQSDARPHYDVIIMSEFRMVGGNTLSSIEELKAQCRAGLKTAICQVNSFRKGVVNREFYPVQIHDMLNRGEIDHVDLTSDVTAKVLNIRYPAIFQFADGMKTNIKAETVQVIVNQPPAEADSRDRRYDVGACVDNIERIFGVRPKWLPIGPSVRDALGDLPPGLLSTGDWFNIIDVDEWAVPRDNFLGDRPVIGRHGRDDRSKWPETAKTLYAAYPNDPRYVVRVMGGTNALLSAGFEIPANWESLPFSDVPPAEFLKTIDFFVYFHHSQRIEAFGRTVIEAMASGCVAILPKTFQPLFGDAAIYCEPKDVTAVVDGYYADFARFKEQSKKGVRFVRENFGYEKHVARLEKLGVGQDVPRDEPAPETKSLLPLVEKTFPHIQYMKPSQAEFIRDLIRKHDLNELLELGTYHGKGTAYLSLIQEERGKGHVTTLDLERCLEHSPNVHGVLSKLGVTHRATVRLTQRSFTHTLMKMLEETPRPTFDFAYIDGAHTWDGSGFAFLLVDMMLRPGGWVIFDDLPWTIADAEKRRKARRGEVKKTFYSGYSREEKELPLVRKVWELIVPKAGYINRYEHEGWGIAQKPGGT